MAGGAVKFRHLSRDSSHRQALLRNLVTSLFKHESISTTWHKAKEAQRLAEKLITMGKKNTEASRREATKVLYEPELLVPKLFGPIRERYLERPGGYTRVLRIEPLKEDQAPSALLQLVDGPKDVRFSITASVVARLRQEGKSPNELTSKNIKKVTQFRKGGIDALKKEVEKLGVIEKEEVKARNVRRTYPSDARRDHVTRDVWGKIVTDRTKQQRTKAFD
ncbi:MAG: hypothetical protein M1834_001939 [Cirrosporium novae-zelandiae]|nr:MAG: hypothetical protein M1834_001939 [Cirrosporium novae-zelandiae]